MISILNFYFVKTSLKSFNDKVLLFDGDDYNFDGALQVITRYLPKIAILMYNKLVGEIYTFVLPSALSQIMLISFVRFDII